MATANELLADAMEPTSNNVNEDKVLKIDNNLRTISIPGTVKLLGVESDDDVNRVEFQMERYHGEIDLSEFSFMVNYINANGDGDIYRVTDVDANENTIHFSWLVGRHAFMYRGDVKFIVCLKKLTEGSIVEREFNTTVASLPVLQGLEPAEQIIQEYPDILEDILLRLNNLEETGGASDEQIENAVSKYLTENPIQPGATKEQAEQIQKNKEDIEELKKSGTGGGISKESDPTVPEWAKQESKPSYTAGEVGADLAGTAESKVNEHNTKGDAHSDIRQMVIGLTNKLNALADSDDTTLDQLSEIVAYIKNNKSLIDAITTGKVSINDIVDNLTTNVSNKPLSAAQGVMLKALIDSIVIPSKLPNPKPITINGMTYDGSEEKTLNITAADGGITQETDPTVPDWAKQLTKPSYTANEVGADALGSAAAAVGSHNTALDTHQDIRELLTSLTNRLNALADSDDTTLDQLSEIVAYIKSNKTLIDQITTGKISTSDIANDLVTNVDTKVLSAAQGVALKGMLDEMVEHLNQSKVNAKGWQPEVYLGTDKDGKVVEKNAPPSGTVNGVQIGEKTYKPDDKGIIELPKQSGVPDGGLIGQTLVKNSDTDGDASWKTLTASDVGALGAESQAEDSRMLGGVAAEDYPTRADNETTNYVHNGNFQRFVAQCGICQKHGGTEVYAGDRWVLVNGTLEATKNADGSYSNVLLNGTIRQLVEDAPLGISPVVQTISGDVNCIYGDGTLILSGTNVLLDWVYLTTGSKPIRRTYEQELAICQQYLYMMKAVDQEDAPASILFYGTATGARAVIYTPQRMRYNPTVVPYQFRVIAYEGSAAGKTLDNIRAQRFKTGNAIALQINTKGTTAVGTPGTLAPVKGDMDAYLLFSADVGSIDIGDELPGGGDL